MATVLALGMWKRAFLFNRRERKKNGRRIELHAILFNDYLDPGMAVSGECF